MIDLETTLLAHITNCETAWSMGGFGAVAEFHQDNGEPLTVEGMDSIARATMRGGIRLSSPSNDVVPMAYEVLSKNAARWAHGVALCLHVDEARMNERTSVTELGSGLDGDRVEGSAPRKDGDHLRRAASDLDRDGEQPECRR